MNIRHSVNQVGGFWEHLRHPLDFQSNDIKINLRDQKGNLLLQSVFCGAMVSLVASIMKTKPFTPLSKAGFVLLATGVTEAYYFLFTLVLKTQRIYAASHLKNKQLAEQVHKLTLALQLEKKSSEILEKSEKELSEKEKGLEEFEQAIKLCEEACKSQLEYERAQKLEQMSKLNKEHQLDVNKVFQWAAYQDEKGNSCLHFLFEKTKFPGLLSKAIIEKFPTLVHARNHEGETPLHAIARYSKDGDYGSTIHYLLKSGADVNATNKNGYTPFDLVCFHGDVTFLSCFADPTVDLEKSKEKGCYALRVILKHREKEDGVSSLIRDKLLMVSGWNIQTKQFLVHHACYKADEELLTKILQKWAVDDPTQNNFLNEKSRNDFRWMGETSIDPIDTLLRIKDNPEIRQRMLITLLKFIDTSRKNEYGLFIRALDLGYNLFINLVRPPYFDFSKDDREIWVRWLLKNIKEKDGYVAGLVSCIKMIYKEGDVVDEDLRDVYEQNVR